MNNNHPLLQIDFGCKNKAYSIEASAGTGKTWTIERLYIKALIESDSNTVANILVVTFTNDATNELKHRILQQLQNVIDNIIFIQKSHIDNINSDIFFQYLANRHKTIDYRRDLNILTRAIQNFDMASILTIHGFCSKIITQYQLECDTQPAYELIENRQQELINLCNEFISIKIINNHKLYDKIEHILSRLNDLFDVDSGNSKQKLNLSESIVKQLPNDLFIIKNGKFCLKYSYEDISDDFSYLLATDVDDKLSRAFILSQFIGYADKKYPNLLSLSNTITYDEIIQKVSDSVLSNQYLADSLYEDYPIVFIDEFQDTDYLQWQIFSNIYKLNQDVRGHVVVVGDPKQAIYRFRGADIDTYLMATNIIENKLTLTENFRSTSNVIKFINKLFSVKYNNNSCFGDGIIYNQVIARSDNQFIYPNSQALEYIGFGYNINCKFYDHAVQLVTVANTNNDAETIILNNLATEILILLKADPNLVGKISILVNTNQQAHDVVNYLRIFGIRAIQSKMSSVYETLEAKFIYNILQSLSELSNFKKFNLAVSSYLFGLDLSQLQIHESISNNNIDESFYSDTIQNLKKRFFYYKQVWENSGIVELFYTIFADCVSNGVKYNRRELVNLWQLIELIHEKSIKISNQSELLYWLGKKIRDSKFESDLHQDRNQQELLRLDQDIDQITVMTQHASKGLEYEVVFCPYFASSRRNNDEDFPLFATYKENNQLYSKLVIDDDLADKIRCQNQQEMQRINYVTLTRVKSRLYLYLKQPKITKGGKYNKKNNTYKIHKLFGYVEDDPYDNSHPIFDYQNLFIQPDIAIKDYDLLDSVIAYSRNFVSEDLLKQINIADKITPNTLNLCKMYTTFNYMPSYYRQSYTSITRGDIAIDMADYFIKQIDNTSDSISDIIVKYKYSFLENKQINGASFGILFHKLCENYPLNYSSISKILIQYGVVESIYINEFLQMINDVFVTQILENRSLSILICKSINELQFSLQISKSLNLKSALYDLLVKHYGKDHPYTKSCLQLKNINNGFLSGFVDLFFEHDGKYWILDYKTNKLNDYTNSNTYDEYSNNQLIDAMSEHHYYLQYFLYLVAIKRHLQVFYKIDDATHLIGGAIYYFVRGTWQIDKSNTNFGLVIDNRCQQLIQELDLLLLGDHGNILINIV